MAKKGTIGKSPKASAKTRKHAKLRPRKAPKAPAKTALVAEIPGATRSPVHRQRQGCAGGAG